MREVVQNIDEMIEEIEREDEECEEILRGVCERTPTPPLRIERMRSSTGRVQRETRRSVSLLDYVDLDEFGSEIEE